LYRIADALARMLATILVFTADEIWENLPGDGSRAASVHLAELPVARGEPDEDLAARWERLFALRERVMVKLEEARNSKLIGSSLEATVVIKPRLEDEETFNYFRDQLRYIFIVSEVRLARDGELEGGSPVLTQIAIERAQGQKCERCWNYSTRVGESVRYPTVCERCVEALAEIETSG
jgi:isoleucyl-tRNA synthetase